MPAQNQTDYQKTLNDFAGQLNDLLAKYQSNRLVDAESKKHQKELEKLLKTTNDILSGKASKTEVKGFDSLLSETQKSYKILKESHKDDKKFKKEFVKTFGESTGAGSMSSSLANNIQKTLTDVAQSVKQSTRTLTKDFSDTSLQLLTGPFGAMAKQAFDVSPIKDMLKRRISAHKEKKQNVNSQYQSDIGSHVLGQAHDGFTKIPREGTYMLDKGERVISPSQNTDLSEFLNEYERSKKAGPTKKLGGEVKNLLHVYSEGHSRGYFDPLIETENSLYSEKKAAWKKDKEGFFDRFKILGKIIRFQNEKNMESRIFTAKMWWKRFQEHPIFHSLRIMAKPLTKTMTGIWHYLFGTQKGNTEKIVESNEDIVDAILEGEKKSKKTSFQRTMKNLFNLGAVSEAQKRADSLAENPNQHRNLRRRLGDWYLNKNYKDYINHKKINRNPTTSMFGSGTKEIVNELKEIRKLLKNENKLTKKNRPRTRLFGMLGSMANFGVGLMKGVFRLLSGGTKALGGVLAGGAIAASGGARKAVDIGTKIAKVVGEKLSIALSALRKGTFLLGRGAGKAAKFGAKSLLKAGGKGTRALLGALGFESVGDAAAAIAPIALPILGFAAAVAAVGALTWEVYKHGWFGKIWNDAKKNPKNQHDTVSSLRKQKKQETPAPANKSQAKQAQMLAQHFPLSALQHMRQTPDVRAAEKIKQKKSITTAFPTIPKPNANGAVQGYGVTVGTPTMKVVNNSSGDTSHIDAIKEHTKALKESSVKNSSGGLPPMDNGLQYSFEKTINMMATVVAINGGS